MIIAVAAAVAAVATGASVMEAPAQSKLKVGFVYLGPVGDFGWTYQHEVGRQAVVKALGDKVDTTYLENVNEGPDSERSIEQLARSGHKLIFTTSFGYMDPTVKVARKYPNVFFEHNTGYKRAKNLATYSARFYEGRYIQGQIAAKMSKTGVLGYIGSFPIPGGDLRHQLDHSRRAVDQSEHQGQDHLGQFLVRPRQGGRRRQGAARPGRRRDHAAHRQPGRHAGRRRQRGAHAFGQDSDMIKFGPKAQLTAIVNNWGPYYVERVQAVLDNKWTSGDVWGGLKSKMLVMAPYTNMPDDVKKLAMETEAAITDGKLHPFKCPVVDQDGKTIECKGGTHLDDGQILGMNFYVKGIDDKIPGK